MKIIIHTDGGSRGNPGPSGAGFVLKDIQGKILLAQGLYLGETTNNVAEYIGVVKALEAAISLQANSIELYSDSQLLVRQLNGDYAVRSENIKPLYNQVWTLLDQLVDWQIIHILRGENTQADRLVNQALDAQKDVTETRNTPQSPCPPLRLGVLISGGGRTLLNLLDEKAKGNLNIEVPLVISSQPGVAGVERCQKAGLTVEIARRKDFNDINHFSRHLEQQLLAAKVDLIIQAGWLCLWKIPPSLENRVMNIHPALLPSFGGQGMWGHHVHEAVIKAGCKLSGCTVHFCTDDYDSGPIIVQRSCPVEEGDDPDTLAARVFKQECVAYPEAIRLFAQGRIHVADGRATILPETST